METNKQTYQGWTNYATWRIALEMYSNYELNEHEEELSTYDLAKHLAEQTEYLVADEAHNSEICKSYALAFLNQVNYYEIAQHLKDL